MNNNYMLYLGLLIIVLILPYITFFIIKIIKKFLTANQNFQEYFKNIEKEKMMKLYQKSLVDKEKPKKEKKQNKFFPFSKEFIFLIFLSFSIFTFSIFTINYFYSTKSSEILKAYENQYHIKDFYEKTIKGDFQIVKIGIPTNPEINNFQAIVIDEKNKNDIKELVIYKNLNQNWNDYNLELDKLEEYIGAGMYYQKPIPWFEIGTILVYVIIFGAFGIILFKQMKDSSGNTERKIKKFDGSYGNKVSFNDIGGIESIKNEIVEIVNTLKNWDTFQERGVRLLRGILFYGPAGVGKTMIAKAIASELGIDMFIATGNDFRGKYLGQGAEKVHNTFERIKTDMKDKFSKIRKEIGGKENKLSILFIDEIDTIFKKRGTGHAEDDTVVNAFLHEIDGIEGSTNIIVIGATNHLEKLDDAILSRIDKKLGFKLPTRKERLDISEKIIKKLIEKDKLIKIKKELNLNVFSANTMGFGGRDIENILNEVHRKSIVHNKEINEQLIQETFSDYVLGKDNTGIEVNEKDKKIVTYHELGHGVIGYLNGKQVHTITIIPKGPALGITWSIDKEEKVLKNKKYILEEIQGLSAGRMAEQLWIGEISTGSSNDYERITKLAFSYFKDYNFSYKGFKLGYVLNKQNNDNQLIDNEIYKKLEENVKKLIEDQENLVLINLKKYKKEIDLLAEILIEKEILEEKDLENYLIKK